MHRNISHTCYVHLVGQWTGLEDRYNGLFLTPLALIAIFTT